jgi:hypothetical protein
MPLPEGYIGKILVSAYIILTEAPEADGTFSWGSTTFVVAELRTGEIPGLGYTYGNAAIAGLRRSTFDIPARTMSSKRTFPIVV